MTFVELAALLNASPKSYNDLSAQEKTDVLDLLRPLSGFDAPQKNWFKNWWLACTQVQVDAMNAALPSNTKVEPITWLGQKYLNIDLATDCMGAGATYFNARATIRTLICVNVTPA